MYDHDDIDLEQLLLFDPPPPCTCGRDGWRMRLRIPLTLLAIGLASAGVIGGSFAAWTAQTENPGNQVTAGTIQLDSDQPGIALFDAEDVVPGDTGTGTVELENAGTAPLQVLLTQDSVTATGIEASLRLQVHDQDRNWCYWPVNQAGACPATGGPDDDGYGAWDATGTLADLPLPAIDGSARWPVGETHTFTIAWKLSTTSPNTDQGKSGSFRLEWNGTQ
jgi:predicted ribosomally synthesized peptide with SipW-like signal peptide